MLAANTLLPAVPTKDIAIRKSQSLISMVGFFVPVIIRNER